MATKKQSRAAQRRDEEKALQRYVDQPGQWRDTTPASVKKRQAKAWKKFEESLTPAQRKTLGIKGARSKKK